MVDVSLPHSSISDIHSVGEGSKFLQYSARNPCSCVEKSSTTTGDPGNRQ